MRLASSVPTEINAGMWNVNTNTRHGKLTAQ